MSTLDEILELNRRFVENLPESYQIRHTSKLPKRHLAIFTCMDTRLVEFLEPALGIGRGEVKVIKNAGNTVTGPFEATMRSLIISVFELGVKEIMVIGHHDCGVSNISSDDLIKKMLDRGISRDAIKMIECEMANWLDTFHNPSENVEQVVAKIRTNPLIPRDVPVHGLMFHPRTGAIEVIVDGYKAMLD